ncbi:hypothetical protein D0N50_22665 (plasmid) [Erwinia billingiae]|uniref:hypothetical protein n=1 Tax=Erwinia billingiae TaxID=182337 RepID=UPI0012485ED6|nr:hypothetical protein [Erwinia billingiae]QEW34527.1 hypothetical protein D0N50_22665 [Erwinia billingiae]
MPEQVTTSASTLAPDTPELMSSPHFSETVMHAERVHPVAWASPVSPPACRAEISLSPDSLSAASELAGRLPDAGMFVVLLTLSVVIVRMARVFVAGHATRSDIVSVRHGKAPPASFSSSEMAMHASGQENTRYWQHLLIAFAAAIESEGYALSTDGRSKVTLPFDTRTRAGTAIVKARYRYLSPLQSAEEVEQILIKATDDGYAGNWTDWCQRGAEAAGWYVIRGSYIAPEDDRAETVSPQTR